MTPEEIADRVADVSVAYRRGAKELHFAVREAVLLLLADYDPVTEIMQSDVWDDEWGIYRQTQSSGEVHFFVNGEDGFGFIATGKSALEACQRGERC